MNQNQNTEVKSLNNEAQASATELPVKELVPATTATAEPKSKKAKKNKAAKAKKAAKEAAATTPTAEAKVKKTTKAEAKEEKPLKKKKSAKDKAVADTAKQQKPSIIEEVISHRDVKYIYPEDVVDTLSRKTWRQKTRNKLRQLEREMLRITDQNSKEFKAAKKAYEEFQATVLKVNQAV